MDKPRSWWAFPWRNLQKQIHPPQKQHMLFYLNFIGAACIPFSSLLVSSGGYNTTSRGGIRRFVLKSYWRHGLTWWSQSMLLPLLLMGSPFLFTSITLSGGSIVDWTISKPGRIGHHQWLWSLNHKNRGRINYSYRLDSQYLKCMRAHPYCYFLHCQFDNPSVY